MVGSTNLNVKGFRELLPSILSVMREEKKNGKWKTTQNAFRIGIRSSLNLLRDTHQTSDKGENLKVTSVEKS